MFATTMLFGLETTMIAVTTDASKGVTDRFRSLPMSASAVVLGRCLADMLNSIVGLAILMGTGLLLGWRWHGGISSALTAVGLLLLLRFALLWVGIFCGLLARGPEAVVSVQILVWPISFLSNVFVDPSTMPPWLGMVAQWNPLSATTEAIRHLFMNPGWQAGSWSSEHAVLLAIVWPVLLAAIFLPLSVRAYRRLNR
jgi:ABC-2 type transport system permease protein